MAMYTVHVTREDGLWAAVVDDVAGAATDSRRLDQLDFLVHDLLAGLLDINPDTFDLHWHYDGLSPSSAALVEQVRAAREVAGRAQEEYARTARATARQLLDEQISLRDAATLMQVSHQRVQQLASSS